MEIKQNLPFAHCENCPEFVLKVDDRVMFVDGSSKRFIDIKCKNEWLCKQLEHQLNEVRTNEKTML